MNLWALTFGGLEGVLSLNLFSTEIKFEALFSTLFSILLRNNKIVGWKLFIKIFLLLGLASLNLFVI